MPGVQSGEIYIGSGNRRQGHSSWTGLALLPFGGIGDIRSHGFRNGRIPADEGIAFPGKGAAESGGRGTGRQVAVNLIVKYCAAYAVSVCNGECFRLFRCRGILVLRLLLRGGSVFFSPSFTTTVLGWVSSAPVVSSANAVVGRSVKTMNNARSRLKILRKPWFFILKYSPFIW